MHQKGDSYENANSLHSASNFCHASVVSQERNRNLRVTLGLSEGEVREAIEDPEYVETIANLMRTA